VDRILVTGGSGFLGAETLRRALLAGHDALGTAFQHGRGDLVPLDLRDEGSVGRLFDAQRPDVVVNTAYVQTGDQLLAVTRDGAERVARHAARVGARLIHISTDALFDGDGVGRYQDADVPSPITDYGQAKADAERAVRAAHPEAVIVRTSLIYGAATPGPQECLVLDALESPDRVAFFTDEIRSPVRVGDLAEALVELTCVDYVGVLNMAGADDCDRFEFAKRIATSLGRDPRDLRSAVSAQLGLRRPRNCSLDSSLARSILASPLRGVREVLPDLTPV
jgi:dTDP-4-dehydrorhamnose reductase